MVAQDVFGLNEELKVIAEAFKNALDITELRAHLSHLGSIINAIEDDDIRFFVASTYESINQRWCDYQGPNAVSMLSSNTRKFYAMKTHAWLALVGVGVDLLSNNYARSDDFGEVVLDCPSPTYTPSTPTISSDVCLEVPTVEQFRAHLPNVVQGIFDISWKIINEERSIRVKCGSINFKSPHIQHFDGATITNVVPNDERESDLLYLSRIYVEQDINILQVRWEWGRHMWTEYAGNEMGFEKCKMTILRGRRLEQRAKKLVTEHALIRPH